MKQVVITPRFRGPQTKRSERLRIQKISELSEQCGWQKPLVKLPKDKHQ